MGLSIIGGSGCQLRSLMVGSGGYGGTEGGGSGYLIYMKKPLDNPSYNVWVKPGQDNAFGHGQPSIVSIDGINRTANPGQDF